jgi:hypothetical protein
VYGRALAPLNDERALALWLERVRDAMLRRMDAGWRRWGHVVVLALVLPLALSSALPMFARALGGPLPHVCHCEIRGGHSTCGCPICNPDRDDLRLSDASIRGKCGDDDLAFGGALGSAVLPAAGFTVLPPDVRRDPRPTGAPYLPVVFLVPPTPPPRFALS